MPNCACERSAFGRWTEITPGIDVTPRSDRLPTFADEEGRQDGLESAIRSGCRWRTSSGTTPLVLTTVGMPRALSASRIGVTEPSAGFTFPTQWLPVPSDSPAVE
jgi:hypothetical protein